MNKLCQLYLQNVLDSVALNVLFLNRTCNAHNSLFYLGLVLHHVNNLLVKRFFQNSLSHNGKHNLYVKLQLALNMFSGFLNIEGREI